MAYLSQLLLIIKYESKMLVRSWAFRILTFICLAMAVLQMAAVLSLIYFVSAYLYLGPVFVARNTTMFGLVTLGALLTWIVVFFANDIGSRDRRVGISDVVGSRSLSTGQYVTGRMLGLLLPLTCLMAVIVVISLVANTAFGFRVAPFREYAPMFVFFSVLGVAFAAGLTAFFSVLFKNRLLSSFAALSLILVSAFWLGQQYKVFDIGGYYISGTFSELVGYGPIGEPAVHRLMYLCVTLALVAGAVFFYPKSETARRSTAAVGTFTVLSAAAVAIVAYYSVDVAKDKATQQQWRETLEAATANRAARVDHYDLDLEIMPRRRRINATVTTALRNRDSIDRDTFIFVLDPGLDIDRVSAGGGSPVTISRAGPVVELTLERQLGPGQTIDLVWEYGGRTDPRAAWLNPVEAKTRQERGRQQMAMMMGELAAWIGSRFCFFLPESLWYPIPNSTFGYDYPDKRPGNFATARTSVDMPAGWTAATQGMLVEEGTAAGRTTLVFETAVPVPQLSLCAGEYTKVKTEVNGIECAFYYAPVHSENVELFKDAGDELKRVIGESIERIADKTNMPYPYKTLALVEVPTHCRTFSDSWDGRNLLVQPGMLLLKETDFFNVYFKRTYDRAKKSTKKEGTGATEAQIKAKLIENYFDGNVFGGDLEANLVPNFWQFQVDPAGEAWPVLGPAFTAALSDEALGRHQLDRDRVVARMGQPSGTVNMDGNNVQIGATLNFPEFEIKHEELVIPLGRLDPSEQKKKFVTLMNRKTAGLVRTLTMALGEKQWPQFIRAVFDKYRYRELTLADLEREAAERSDEDVSWIFRQFVSEPVVPGYVITRAEAYEIDTGRREREFQTVVRVANLEEGKGYVQLRFETEGSGASSTVEKELAFDSREEKEVRMVLSDKPKSVRVVPAYSRNLTHPFETLYVPDKAKQVAGEETVRSLPPAERELAVIVDDRDEGFSTVDLRQKARVRLTKLKEKSEAQEYHEYRGFGVPRRWQNQRIDRAYGKYVHTRKIKGRGDGSQLAVWSASLPRDGMYEVFIYAQRMKSGRSKITVKSGETGHEIDFDLAKARTGWNSLGKYRFSADGPARVELSDEIEGAPRGWVFVRADAVKWLYLGAGNAVQ